MLYPGKIIAWKSFADKGGKVTLQIKAKSCKSAIPLGAKYLKRNENKRAACPLLYEKRRRQISTTLSALQNPTYTLTI